MMGIDFSSWSMAITLPIFVAAGLLVWVCGVALARSADALAERTGMGRAFAGVLLLGAATSLPEVATTATATVNDHPALAVNNLLGGAAMQVAVLALVDAFRARGTALTRLAGTSTFIFQGVMLILLLSVACAAIGAGEVFTIWGVGFWSLLLGLSYVGALFLMHRYEQRPQWQPIEQAPDPSKRSEASRETSGLKGTSTGGVVARFAMASGGVLVGGYAVAETGAALASQTGLGESFVGATLVSVTTSLPEVSTTFAAARLGAYSMAAGNILGTNALEMGLFLPADMLYRGGAIFDAIGRETALLAALGILVTAIYLWGTLERRDRTVFGMGIDSVVVTLVYLGGMFLYYQLTT